MHNDDAQIEWPFCKIYNLRFVSLDFFITFLKSFFNTPKTIDVILLILFHYFIYVLISLYFNAADIRHTALLQPGRQTSDTNVAIYRGNVHISTFESVPNR